MIKVEVIREEEDIKQIKACGHSEYEEIGKDIVCSSVSTAFILTINLLERLNIDCSYESNEAIPLISLTINRYSCSEHKLVQAILENLVLSLENVSKQYKKNLKINKIRR